MEQRDSHCPYDFFCETTAKGTGLGYSAGKEDPVELDSSMFEVSWGFVKRGGEYAGVTQWKCETTTSLLTYFFACGLRPRMCVSVSAGE